VIIITHDLGVVAELADDLLVVYGGKAVEQGSCEEVFHRAEHPYTWGLLGSMPRMDRDRQDRLMPIKGSPPSLINLPSGCSFNPRCPYPALNKDRCVTEVPELAITAGGHKVACHLQPQERHRIWTEEVSTRL
jgi:peptide/nickel transport system ATP-binding protein